MGDDIKRFDIRILLKLLQHVAKTIRMMLDRPPPARITKRGHHKSLSIQVPSPVSYTHLTLPTICSV